MALTKLNNKAVANITSIPVALGDMVLVSSATASSSASIEFTLGNYKEYKFFFVNMHPSIDATHLGFQTSTDSGSTYGITTTSTLFRSYHYENDTGAGVAYRSDYDLAQSTNFIPLADGISTGADNDQSVSGTINLFNPSSNTYVKHFICNANECHQVDISVNVFIGGYFNTTSPLTNIKFQMSSGNIDAGKILMFGIN
jgi:hypothetical protein